MQFFHYWKYSLGVANDIGHQKKVGELVQVLALSCETMGGIYDTCIVSTFPHIFSFIPPSWQVHIYATSYFEIAQQTFIFSCIIFFMKDL